LGAGKPELLARLMGTSSNSEREVPKWLQEKRNSRKSTEKPFSRSSRKKK
jgi:hypothetical protein